MTGETRCGAAAVLPSRPLEPPSRRSPSRAAFVSAEKVFASLPQVERGVSKILGGDPKGNNFLYTNGKCVILRNIDVSVPPSPPPPGTGVPLEPTWGADATPLGSAAAPGGVGWGDALEDGSSSPGRRRGSWGRGGTGSDRPAWSWGVVVAWCGASFLPQWREVTR